MKLKRLLSVILLSVFLVSVCSFSSFAEDLNTGDFSVLMGRETPNDAGGVTTNYFTFSVVEVNSGGAPCYGYVPNDYSNFWKAGAVKLLTAFESTPLVAGHEYALDFYAGISFSTYFDVIVKFGSQQVFSQKLRSTQVAQHITASFTAPDFISSETITIELRVPSDISYGTSTTRFYVSRTISLTDTTDNPGWLGKILQNFTNLGDRISTFFSGLTDSISGFFSDLKQSIVNQFNNVKQWFVDLGNDIKGFFTSLKNYLLYFEDPVTLDSNGVPIGADGKPVYTNPFASKIDEFEQTINGWLTQIQNFVNQIGSAGTSVSSYIKNGSSVVTGVLGAVPVLTAVLTFALLLLVVRKVVGR